MNANSENNQASPQEESYGTKTLKTLQTLLANGPKSDFWEWRREFKSRAEILNKAGLSLWKNDDGSWNHDLSKVSVESLNNALSEVREWNAGASERRDRQNQYLNRADRTRRRERGW